MQITKSWLLNKKIDFWHNLMFLLHHTSPYFGKLQWYFQPELMPLGTPGLATYQSTLNQLADNANPEQICRSLMMNIFWVAPDYQRPLLEDLSLNEELPPRYPRYRVVVASPNYRPLQPEEIQPEDIKNFQQKLQVLRTSLEQRLIEEYTSLGKFHREKMTQVKQKLTQWTQLLTNHD